MAITFVADSEATGGSSFTCPKPTGVQADDFMLMVVCHGAGSAATSSGWTQVLSQTTGASWSRTTVLRKVAGGSEPSSYTVNAESSFSTLPVIITAYRGVDTTNPIQDSSSAGSTTVEALDTGNVTSTDVGWLFAAAGTSTADGGATTHTISSGTKRETAASGYRTVTTFDSNGDVAAGTYSRTITASPATDGNAVVLLSLLDGTSEPVTGSFGVTASAATADLAGERTTPDGTLGAEAPAVTGEFEGTFYGNRLTAVAPGPTTNIDGGSTIEGQLTSTAPAPTYFGEGGRGGEGLMAAVAPAAQFAASSETRISGSRVVVVLAEDRETIV